MWPFIEAHLAVICSPRIRRRPALRLILSIAEIRHRLAKMVACVNHSWPALSVNAKRVSSENAAKNVGSH